MRQWCATGFVEESDLPGRFRRSPLNGVWEGSGNVICLKVADAFCASRFGPGSGRAFGQLPVSIDAGSVVGRASPFVG